MVSGPPCQAMVWCSIRPEPAAVKSAVCCLPGQASPFTFSAVAELLSLYSATEEKSRMRTNSCEMLLSVTLPFALAGTPIRAQTD